MNAKRLCGCRRTHPRARWATYAALVLLVFARAAAACPFCMSLKPTLTQRREAASVVVLGELLERDGKQAVFRLHQVLQGQSFLTDAKGAEAKETRPQDAGAKEAGTKEAGIAKTTIERLRIATD